MKLANPSPIFFPLNIALGFVWEKQLDVKNHVFRSLVFRLLAQPQNPLLSSIPYFILTIFLFSWRVNFSPLGTTLSSMHYSSMLPLFCYPISPLPMPRNAVRFQ